MFNDGLAAFLKANRELISTGKDSCISPPALQTIEQISEPAVENLLSYLQLLTSWSAKMNLVGDSAPEVLIERHIFDCAALHAILHSRNKVGGPILDIGSGAGLPGMILAILAPEIPITLCEPRAKRVQFLLEVKRRLNLKNVEVSQARVEELAAGQGAGTKFQIITARAVAAPGELLEAGRGLLLSNGYAALMVGPQTESEVAATALTDLIDYRLGDGRGRAVLITSSF